MEKKAKKVFEFVKDYPQGGHKKGQKLTMTGIPLHLREYLKEVTDKVKKEKIKEAQKAKDKEQTSEE